MEQRAGLGPAPALLMAERSGWHTMAPGHVSMAWGLVSLSAAGGARCGNSPNAQLSVCVGDSESVKNHIDSTRALYLSIIGDTGTSDILVVADVNDSYFAHILSD